MARIALVCEPPEGGVPEHVAQLALGLRAHGHEPVVFASAGFMHAGRVAHVTLPFRRDYAHPHLDARSLGALARALRGFDLVHGHAAKGGVLARLAGAVARVPAVYSPHCFPFVGEVSEARRRATLAAERALAPLTAALVCVCEQERELALAHGIHARLAVIHNGTPACTWPEAAHGLRAGAIAQLRRQKRLDVLLDAAPAILDAVPDATVAIIGDGPERERLRAHPAASRVAFEPFRPPSARHLRTLDVYILPSAWEAFPIGPLEAQACGVPQVVTDVGGTREAVDGETGIVVPAGDSDALAGAVVELLREPARRERLAVASRARHAERFTVEAMVAATAALYDEVLSRRRGRR